MIAFNYMKKINGEDPGQTPDPNPDPNPSKKCPNKPECNVETCECGVEYCSTHDLHVCIDNEKEYSRKYLRVELEDLEDAGFDGIFYVTHSRLQRYNFTDERWEAAQTNPEFEQTSYYDSESEIEPGMYTYTKLTKQDMNVTVLQEDLGEYVCAYNEAPPKP